MNMYRYACPSVSHLVAHEHLYDGYVLSLAPDGKLQKQPRGVLIFPRCVSQLESSSRLVHRAW